MRCTSVNPWQVYGVENQQPVAGNYSDPVKKDIKSAMLNRDDVMEARLMRVGSKKSHQSWTCD